MKKQILFFVMMLLPMVTSADDAVKVGDIWYNLIPKGKVASVTSSPNGVKYSGSVVIPPSFNYNNVDYNVTGIGSYAFYECSGLTSVTIPNCVKSIGESAFHNCTGLTSVTLPNSVTSMGKHAFDSCIGLTSFVIPNGVTSIEDMTFSSCTGLTSVTIPNSVTSIKLFAFAGCTGLTSVNIPNSVVSIGEYAFGVCTGLTSLTIPNSVTSLGNRVFESCTGLTSLTIGSGVREISENAFNYCTSLTSVTIPNSVTSLEFSAFAECSSLLSVTIGSGIERIYDNAFGYCPELTDVFCWAAKVPEMRKRNGEYGGTDAFQGSLIEYVTLHVPSTSIDSYKEVEPWKSFGEIVALDGTTPPQQNKCATPTIVKAGSKLKFECATPGATISTRLTANIEPQEKTGSEMVLETGSITYTLTVVATAEGYEASDPATMDITIERGDVNCDGNVNSADIQKIYGIMAE